MTFKEMNLLYTSNYVTAADFQASKGVFQKVNKRCFQMF